MAAPSSTEVDALAAMFPDVERAVIETILEAQNGDSNRAIDAILVLKGEAQALPAAKPSPQVEADSALAKALHEKMVMEDEANRQRSNSKPEESLSEDFKAVGEAFESMGKAITRGWRELTEKLSEVPLFASPNPTPAEPSDEDVRLVRRSATLPAESPARDPAIPASSPDSGNPLLEPSDPDDVLTLTRALPVTDAQSAAKN